VRKDATRGTGEEQRARRCVTGDPKTSVSAELPGAISLSGRHAPRVDSINRRTTLEKASKAGFVRAAGSIKF